MVIKLSFHGAPASVNQQTSGGASNSGSSINDSDESVSGFVQGRLDSMKKGGSDDWSSDGALAASSDSWSADEEGGNSTQVDNPREDELDIIVRYNELGIETTVPVGHPVASTMEPVDRAQANDAHFPTSVGSSLLQAPRQRRPHVAISYLDRMTYEQARTPQEKEKMERQISEAAARANKTYRIAVTGEVLECLGLIKLAVGK